VLGLIPAGAGQITVGMTADSGLYGSSPRVRGRCSRVVSCMCFFRLIPAGAGQISSIYTGHGLHTAHPRGCGADPLKTTSKYTIQGSSPRVRGRLSLQTKLDGSKGLIPAGAGQILLACCRVLLSWGSSPRVRGRSQEADTLASMVGLIPAGAGQIGMWAWWKACLRAHPRGCGADFTYSAFTTHNHGSSPRVRGR